MSSAAFRGMSAPPTSTSELAALVETEARLDAELAAARVTADRELDAARCRAAEIAASIDDRIAREHERIAAEVTAETSARLEEIREDERAQIARFDAVRGDRLAAIAKELVERVAQLALAEAEP